MRSQLDIARAFEELYALAILNYHANQYILASASNGEYTTVIVGVGAVIPFIHPDLIPSKVMGIKLHFKRTQMPYARGRWMDWPETHWGLTDDQYYALPITERALLEATEQVNYWTPKQFSSLTPDRTQVI